MAGIQYCSLLSEMGEPGFISTEAFTWHFRKVLPDPSVSLNGARRLRHEMDDASTHELRLEGYWKCAIAIDESASGSNHQSDQDESNPMSSNTMSYQGLRSQNLFHLHHIIMQTSAPPSSPERRHYKVYCTASCSPIHSCRTHIFYRLHNTFVFVPDII